MTLNYRNLRTTGFLLGAYLLYYGVSWLKNEFKGARYSITKKGPSLDTLVKTSYLGEFEIKILENSKGEFDLDELNYHPKITSFPKMDLYKASGAITPAVSKSPFTYKITTRNNNTDIQTFVNHLIINGGTKVKIGPDKNGIYQVKRVTFYDNSGKKLYSFVPTTKKPKPPTPTPASTPTSTSAGNPSP